MVVVWLALVVLAVVIVDGVIQVQKEERLAKLSSRAALTPHEFYTEFYAGSKLDERCVIQVLGFIDEWLDYPVGKLRPTDRFGHEIASVELDVVDSELDVFWDATLNRYEQRLSPGQVMRIAEDIRTLDEFIRAFAPLEEAINGEVEG